METGGQVFGSDVTARDVQAVTSPANRTATAKQSLGALRAAALGGGGKPQQQSPSLGLALPDGKPIRRYHRPCVLCKLWLCTSFETREFVDYARCVTLTA